MKKPKTINRQAIRKAIEKKCDALWAVAVKTRDGWTCQRCHKYFPEGYRRGLAAMHCFTRSNHHTRWILDNGAAGCTHCHFYFDSHTTEKDAWFEERIGKEKWILLKYQKNSTATIDRWGIRIGLEQVLKKLEDEE